MSIRKCPFETDKPGPLTYFLIEICRKVEPDISWLPSFRTPLSAASQILGGIVPLSKYQYGFRGN